MNDRPSTSTSSYPARIAERAAQIRPVRLLLGVLVLPLYVAGFVAAAVVVVVLWCASAVAVGWHDARARLGVEPEADEVDR